MKSNSLYKYNSDRIFKALDRWKILWDNHLKHVAPDFTRYGFFKNSLEFWQLTKLVLKTEGNTSRMTKSKPLEVDFDSMTEINELMQAFQGVSIS